MQEYIIFAAMRQMNSDKEVSLENKNFRVGLSHGDIINGNMFCHLKVGYNANDYGFLTNKCRFVSREEASDIARNAGQLLPHCTETKVLNSYEIDMVKASNQFKTDNYKMYNFLKYFDGDESE